jgi:broad specificity phosphatase PhoE
MQLAMATLASSLKDLPPLAAGRSRLFLCRHGETDSNAQSLLQGSGVDAPLNAVGRSQAATLAASLASTMPAMDAVFSSTLSRSVETADIVAGSQRGPALQRASHAGLAEMFYGSLEGRPIAETRSQLRELSEAWSSGRTDVAVGGDGESPDALLVRAHATLWGDGRLLGQCEAGRYVTVIAHSTFNKAVLAAATGQGLGKMFSLPQDNCCVNVLDFAVADASVNVVALNLAPGPASEEGGGAAA